MATDKTTLRTLQIIDIGEGGDIEAPTLAKITPADLARDRGLDVDRLFGASIFVDRHIGYAIVHQGAVDKIRVVPPARGIDGGDGGFYTNWTATVLSPQNRRAQPTPADPPPWYVALQGRWPQERGAGACVAIFDSGILSGTRRLPRRINSGDFCACEGRGLQSSDSSSSFHGTRCAGAAGARDIGDVRTSPAPDSTLIAARVYRYAPELYTSLVDILLMLSWVVENAWTPAIVSMSFVLDNDEVDRYPRDVLHRIVGRLRNNDLALIFAATELHDANTLSYPGRLDNVVAVGAYQGYLDDRQKLYIELPLGCNRQPWLDKTDLLFGPANSVRTCDDRQSSAVSYGEVSAACAFSAGVAALYLKQYGNGGDGLLNRVVDEMKQHAMPLPDSKIDRYWLAVGTDPLAMPKLPAATRVVIPCSPE